MAALIVVLLAGTVWFMSLKRPEASELHPGQTRQLTFAPELELDPALSPDGKIFAYAAGTPERTDIYVQPLSGGEPLNLTKDDPGLFHRWPRWSRDGRMIAFMSSEPTSSGFVPFGDDFNLEVVPYPNGPSHKIAKSAMLGHTWSPDGKNLAYTRNDREVWVSSMTGGSARKVAEAYESNSPAWSPDGKWIAFVSGNRDFAFQLNGLGNQATSSIIIAPAGGGPSRMLTDNVNANLNPVWMPDSRTILFISNRDRGGSREVFKLKVSDTGEPVSVPVRMTTGLNPFLIDLSGDGRQLAYSTFLAKTNLWSLQISESGPVSADAAKPVTTGAQSIEGVSVSRDGEWIAFDSNRSGNQDIYKMRRSGGTPEQLTHDPSDDFLPSWSPDGKSIAFYSFRNGNRDIYIMSADGTGEEQITNDPAEERYPDWSPDGRQLVFFSDKGGTQQLYIVSKTEGHWGTPRRLTNEPSFWPRWSPDGRFIAYMVFLRPPDGGIGIISPDGTGRKLLVASGAQRNPVYLTWSTDGKAIYFKGIDFQNRVTVWSVPPNGGTPKLMVRFDDPLREFRRNEFAASAKEFFFPLAEWSADIWVLKLDQ